MGAVVSGRHVDVMDHARDLGLAPALLDMQGADEVRPFLAAELDQRGVERRPRSANSVSKYPPLPGAAARAPTAPGLSADNVAVKPPPNEAV